MDQKWIAPCRQAHVKVPPAEKDILDAVHGGKDMGPPAKPHPRGYFFQEDSRVIPKQLGGVKA